MQVTEMHFLLEILRTIGFTSDKIMPLILLYILLYVSITRHLDKGLDKIHSILNILNERTDLLEAALIEIQTILSSKWKFNITHTVVGKHRKTTSLLLKD